MSKDKSSSYTIPIPEGTTRVKVYYDSNYLEQGQNLILEGSLKIRLGQQYSSARPTPGTLMQVITHNDRPLVIIPNGEVLVPSHDEKYQHQHSFSDNVARQWAEQNNGIYHPSNFGSSKVTIPFQNFLTSLGRTKSNYQNRNGKYENGLMKKMHKESVQALAFNDLEMEVRYLNSVGTMRSTGLLSGEVIGLEGIIHEREEENKNFGTSNAPLNISLGLDLRGFGHNHFKVSGRRLTSTFRRYTSIKENSPEYYAINDFIRHAIDISRNGDPQVYDLRICLIPKEGSKNLTDGIKIEMNTSYGSKDDNSDMKYPVMQTPEMLEIFVPLMTQMSEGLKNIKEDRGKKRQKERTDAYTLMFGELKSAN